MNTSGTNRTSPSSAPLHETLSPFQNETCPDCDRLAAELDRIRAAASADLSNAHADLMVKNREIGRLKAIITRQDDDAPEHEQVRELLVLWRDEIRGKVRGPKPDIAADSKRATRVRWALKKYGKERTRKAILGAQFDDWAMGRVRKTEGRTFCDIAKHILLDEETFEKFETLYEEQTAPTLDSPQLRSVPDAKPRRDGPVVKRIKSVEAGEAPPIDKALHGITMAGYEWRATASPDIWRAQCPAHDGDGFSLKITRNYDGMLLINCKVGCDTEDVLRAIGMEWRDCWENSERDHQVVGYRSEAERAAGLPPHLKQAMRQILARSEREAA